MCVLHTGFYSMYSDITTTWDTGEELLWWLRVTSAPPYNLITPMCTGKNIQKALYFKLVNTINCESVSQQTVDTYMYTNRPLS